MRNDDPAKWKKENEKFCKDLTKDLANSFFNAVVPLTPVRSGRLREGWKIQASLDPAKPSAQVTNDVPYLQYVNNGTKYIKPRRFIEIAFQRALNDFDNKN